MHHCINHFQGQLKQYFQKQMHMLFTTKMEHLQGTRLKNGFLRPEHAMTRNPKIHLIKSAKWKKEISIINIKVFPHTVATKQMVPSRAIYCALALSHKLSHLLHQRSPLQVRYAIFLGINFGKFFQVRATIRFLTRNKFIGVILIAAHTQKFPISRSGPKHQPL